MTTDTCPDLDIEAQYIIAEAEQILSEQTGFGSGVTTSGSEVSHNEKLGSEPELRKDEAVCPVTGYTYFAAKGRSPYIDWDEKRGEWVAAW